MPILTECTAVDNVCADLPSPRKVRFQVSGWAGTEHMSRTIPFTLLNNIKTVAALLHTRTSRLIETFVSHDTLFFGLSDLVLPLYRTIRLKNWIAFNAIGLHQCIPIKLD
jgi:hypothetical protein